MAGQIRSCGREGSYDRVSKRGYRRWVGRATDTLSASLACRDLEASFQVVLPPLDLAQFVKVRESAPGQFLSQNLVGITALPGVIHGPRKQPYLAARKKLDTARSVQTMIPANANRRANAGQEDSQIPSPAMMGRNNTQMMISTNEGNARTESQSKPNHSRFTSNAKANPTHSMAKIAMAYVLSNRGTATLHNDEFLIVAFPDLQCR